MARGLRRHVEAMERRVLLSAYALSQRGSFGFSVAGGSQPVSTLAVDSAGNLFGTTQTGGPANEGTVFELPKGSSTMTTLAAFNAANTGHWAEGAVAVDNSGDVFGTTDLGGAYGDGTVFEVARGSGTITTLVSFSGANGANPVGGLIRDSSGNLYGTTLGGGAFYSGTAFEIAAGSATLTTIASFNTFDGYQPTGELTLDSSGDIYGTASGGGSNGDGTWSDYGTVFEIANGSTAITVLAQFSGTNGSDPSGSIAIDAAGNLYGATFSGSADGDGTVFEIAPGSGTITTLVSFDGQDGARPQGGVTLDPAGNLYGTTQSGGLGGGGSGANSGTVFEVAGGTNAITTLVSFNFMNGQSPDAGVTLDTADNLYGTTSQGGRYGVGTLFKVGAGTQAATTLATFGPDDGDSPQAPVTLDAFGNLYGTTFTGGSDAGTVFEISAGSTLVTTLASFTGGNGLEPQGGLIVDASGNLYGTTSEGGASGDGTVFEIAKGSNTVTTIATFNVLNGEWPLAGLTRDSLGDFYGTTELGGAHADGTVFEIAKGSTAVTVLASFNGNNGSEPQAGATLDGSGNLYGTTSIGGADGDGTVYEIANGSGSITTLASFDGANGADPKGGVTLDAAGDLYGTTYSGGANNDGTVFEIAGGTSAITTLVSFDVTSGQYPDAGVTLDAAGNLYGTTRGGSAKGTVFEIANGSSAVTILANVANSEASVTLDASGNLYGTTSNGGIVNRGSVFELTPNTAVSLSVAAGANPSTPDQPLTFTATVGGGVPDGEMVTLVDASNSNAVVATGTLSGGSATLTVPAGTFSAGTHKLVAVYAGDANFAASGSVPYTQTVQAAVTSVVVNANNAALAGVQRSMVDSIVYTFSQAVTLAATNAFAISIHAGQTGTVPTLNWSAINPDANGGGTQWVVTFSGAGVTGGSIGDGVYDITLNSAAVSVEGNASATVATRPADTFYRLYGDVTGDGRVNNADYNLLLNSFNLKSGQAGYLAALDATGTGSRINNADYNLFLNNFNVRLTGFTATI